MADERMTMEPIEAFPLSVVNGANELKMQISGGCTIIDLDDFPKLMLYS